MTAAIPGRWLDQVESLARDALPEPVFRYIVEGARDDYGVVVMIEGDEPTVDEAATTELRDQLRSTSRAYSVYERTS